MQLPRPLQLTARPPRSVGNGLMSATQRRLAGLANHIAAEAELALPALATTDPTCHDFDAIDLEPAAYLQSRLTAAERQQFSDNGYLLVKGALGADHVADLTATLDEQNRVKTLEQAARDDPAMPDAMNRMGIFVRELHSDPLAPFCRLRTWH